MNEQNTQPSVAPNELQTYSCTVIFDASASIEVQATSPEEAATKAEDELNGNQRLCNQCADELETGDIVGTLVYGGESGEQIIDTTMYGDERRERAALIAAHEAELRAAVDLAERLKQEAQIHAQEARTANATIAEIYKLVTGSTGEPGNWNGAEPVREYMRAAVESNERLAEALEKIALAGMAPSPEMSENGVEAWHARQAWSFIGIAARAITPSGASK